MKNKSVIFKFVGSVLIFIVCAFFALALLGMSEAHGHGITSGDKRVIFILSLISVVSFVISLNYLKKIIYT